MTTSYAVQVRGGRGVLRRVAAAVAPSTAPELPRVLIDTSAVPAITGATWTPTDGAGLQAALDGAALGDVISLDPSLTYTGHFTLPNKTSGSGWITVRSSAHASLTFGVRVSPSQVALMPKIVGAGSPPQAFSGDDNAHHYWFIGLEIAAPTTPFCTTLINLTSPSLTDATMQSAVTFDRCYIHGDPTIGCRRGVALNGRTMAVIHCYVSDFKEDGADTQAIWGYNGWGPFKIVNNYLEAAAENVMFGGSDPTIANLIPSDIEIRQNHFFKPLSWKIGDPSYNGTPWSVKNILELKNAQRVLVDGNRLENIWPHAQAGYAILIKSVNQEGTAPWSVSQDVTVTNNVIVNAACGFSLTGTNEQLGGRSSRILVRNNVCLGLLTTLFQIAAGLDACTVEHNVGFLSTADTETAVSSDGDPNTRIIIRDNIMGYGVSGVKASGFGEGSPSIVAAFPGGIWDRNLLVGTLDLIPYYPAAPATYIDDTMGAIGFVSYPFGSDYHDYALAPGSPYYALGTGGTPLGIDAAAIAAAL